jgi:hypothetical protein
MQAVRKDVASERYVLDSIGGSPHGYCSCHSTDRWQLRLHTYRATMVLFKNFKCAINVGNDPLTEYTDPDDAGDRAGAVPTAIASRPAAPLRMLMIRPTAPSTVATTLSATRDSMTYLFDDNHRM